MCISPQMMLKTNMFVIIFFKLNKIFALLATTTILILVYFFQLKKKS
jgi:hypothetical protein